LFKFGLTLGLTLGLNSGPGSGGRGLSMSWFELILSLSVWEAVKFSEGNLFRTGGSETIFSG